MIKSKAKQIIHEWQISRFLAEFTGIKLPLIEFLSIGVHRDAHKSIDVASFYRDYISNGVNVLISNNSAINLHDGLVPGFYVQVKNPDAFYKFVTNDNVIVSGFTIDSDYDERELKVCLRLVAESMYSKNKKIAMYEKLDNNILFSERKEYDDVVKIVQNLKSLL